MATYGTLSMDFLPDEKTRLTTRGDWGAFTDGNDRRWTQVELERRVWPNPHFFLGARYTDMPPCRRWMGWNCCGICVRTRRPALFP